MALGRAVIEFSEDHMKRVLMDVMDEGEQKIVSCGSRELPIDLVFELCLRLPIKKVYQFTLVSRAWRTIITQPDFSQAYHSHNPPGFLVLSGIDLQAFCWQFHYSLLRVHKAEQFIHTPLKVPFDFELTEVVNGLVCAFHFHDLDVYNIWTGASIRLPHPNMNCDPADGLDYISTLNYYFGFDPVNEVYKLLKITGFDCEILTLSSSNSLWRKLSGVDDSFFFSTNRILINGVLFCDCWSKLASFNFSEEKFQCVQLPDKEIRSLSWLAQSRGRLTLIYISDGEKMILYILNDSEGYSWTKYETILPCELHSRNCSRAVYVGNLPTGEILLAYGKSQDSSTPVYSYDCEKNKFEKFVVGKLPCSIRDYGLTSYRSAMVAGLEQNAGALDALIPGIS